MNEMNGEEVRTLLPWPHRKMVNLATMKGSEVKRQRKGCPNKGQTWWPQPGPQDCQEGGGQLWVTLLPWCLGWAVILRCLGLDFPASQASMGFVSLQRPQSSSFTWDTLQASPVPSPLHSLNPFSSKHRKGVWVTGTVSQVGFKKPVCCILHPGRQPISS